jgi:hypothetical protein
MKSIKFSWNLQDTEQNSITCEGYHEASDIFVITLIQ